MSDSEKIVFSTQVGTRVKSSAKTGRVLFEADEAKIRDELNRKYREQRGRGICELRVDPELAEFCWRYWDESTRRLQFETKHSYDECSREVARRDPWVYFSRGAPGYHTRYDVTFAGSEDDE